MGVNWNRFKILSCYVLKLKEPNQSKYRLGRPIRGSALPIMKFRFESIACLRKQGAARSPYCYFFILKKL